MQKIKDFLKAHKYAIIWTLCYFVCVWLVLYFLFGFDVFSCLDWWRLAHAHLRGFGAFVFCILLLAVVPLYVATTAVIARTQKPLITIPVPKFLTKPVNVPDSSESVPEPESESVVLRDDLPAELREPFLRARTHMNQFAVSGINNIDLTMFGGTDAPGVPNDTPELPLPPTFDDNFDSDDGMDGLSEMPVFSPVQFDSETTEDNSVVYDFLKSKNIDADIYDDIVVCQDLAIITHNDSDFWIADDDDWVAKGKQKISPVSRVLDFAKANNLHPVLFLAEHNIMSLDKSISHWQSQGVSVIDTLADLEKLLLG
ncbi:MAG: hypothetical protein KBS86_01885 [Proteobacteria bacterium]|nr:hypothetical protein [Candidatus Enterousia scatequi]